MAYSSRSTSPDPLTLPSSPLAQRSNNPLPGRRRPKPTKPPAKSIAAQISSPSKSYIMDTGNPGDASPWRIKVTVEAEPKEVGSGSPAKKVTRTTKVPLKGGASSSPAKRPSTVKKKAEEEHEAPEPQRKRKGTPIRRRNTRARAQADEEANGDEQDEETRLLPASDSPSKQPAMRTRRMPAQTWQPTERSKRLTQAREELDVALREAVAEPIVTPQDAVNSYDVDNDENIDPDNNDVHDDDEIDIAPEDMTIAHDEDFTMVSVETLQSMKQNTSQLLENSGFEDAVGGKSGISVSYLPSSPPVRHQLDEEVRYPDVSAQASAIKQRGVVSPSAGAGSNVVNAVGSGGLRSNVETPSTTNKATQQQVQSIARYSDKGSTVDQAIVVEDVADDGAEDPDDDEPDAEDIWAEEASRSLEEEPEQPKQQHRSTAPVAHSPQLNDIFGNEAQPPPRPKIPRTWRRNSGADFSYVDSPEYGAFRKPSGTSTDGDGGGSRSSGVMTPPSTDDEEGFESQIQDPSEVDVEDDIDLTQPDAAATMLQAEPEQRRAETDRQQALGPGSDSSSSGVSPDGDRDDSGMFWQTNLPNVYQQRGQRPRFERQKRAMDLSELLNSNKSSSPVKESVKTKIDVGRSTRAETRVNKASRNGVVHQVRRLEVENGINTTEKIVSSPLRKSLLKSSKVGGSALPAGGSREIVREVARHTISRTQKDEADLCVAKAGLAEDSITESFDSKASDERQLLAEMGSATSRLKYRASGQQKDELRSEDTLHGETEYGSYITDERYERTEKSCYGDDDESEECSSRAGDISESYEERLNLDSPQKIKVKFNDSDYNSSLLAPKRDYPPLFGQQRMSASTAHKRPLSESPASMTLVSKKEEATAAPPQPGIFSRLSTTFWSAVVRPSGPVEIEPTEQQPDPIYPHWLRCDIRSRYGVHTDQHPWTMAHMRTLHRLLNSCTSNMPDSVVPETGPLPSGLERLVGKKLPSVTSFSWVLTEQHAHVVDAFMQTLVPDYVAQAIRSGEMEFLGDEHARTHRGWFGVRHGDDICFEKSRGFKELKGTIERAWVVKALGNCVEANMGDEAEMKAAAEEAERRKRVIEVERRAWEKKNGIVYDEEDEVEAF